MNWIVLLLWIYPLKVIWGIEIFSRLMWRDRPLAWSYLRTSITPVSSPHWQPRFMDFAQRFKAYCQAELDKQEPRRP